MALSLAACGGSSTTTTTATDSTATDTTTTVTAVSSNFTTEVDVLAGTTADDTFVGDAATMSAADSIAAGAGTDTFKAYGVAAGSLPEFSGVENLEIHNVTPGDVDLTSDTFEGVVHLTLDGFTANGETVTAKAGDTLKLADITSDGTDVIALSTAATVTSISLEMGDDVGLTSTTELNLDINATGVATINLALEGENYIEFDTAGATLATTLTVTGAGKGAVETDAEITTIDASATTGDISIIAGDTADNTITGGSGANVIDMGTTLTAADTVDGGDGKDTLVVGSSVLVSTGTISNIEVVELEGKDKTIDADAFAGVTEYTATGAADSGALKFDDMVSGNTYNLKMVDDTTDATDTLTVDLATDGTADSLTLNVGDADTAVNIHNFVADDAETVSIVLAQTDNDADHDIEGLTLADATSVTVTGAGDAVIAAINLKDAAHTFDASAATGDLTLTFSDSQDQTITTGSGTDQVTVAGLDNDDKIDGGDGTDTFIMASAVTALPSLIDVANFENVTLKVGATAAATSSDLRLMTGVEKLTVIAGTTTDENVTLSGLAAATTVALDTWNQSANGGDTITLDYASGAASATVTLDTVGASDTNDWALTIDSGVTTVSVSTDDAASNLDTFTTGATALTIAIGADGGLINIDSLAATALETLTLTAATDFHIEIDGGTTDTSLTTIDASGIDTGTDGESGVTLGTGASIMDRATTATVTLGHGDDTLSFDVSKHGSNVIVADAGADTLSAGGSLAGNMVVDLSSTTDQITTLNGSGNTAAQTGFESIDLSAVTVSSGAITITGSSAVNSITGSAGADTIKASTGADTIDGGAGTDALDLSVLTLAAADAGIAVNISGGTITGSAGTLEFSKGDATAAYTTIATGKIAFTGTASESLTADIDTVSNVETFTLTTGADRFYGGSGKETITGNGGSDYFAVTGQDVITDFKEGATASGGDVLDLSVLGNSAKAGTFGVLEGGADVTLKVHTDTTGSVELADNQVIAFSTLNISSYDDATEIGALFHDSTGAFDAVDTGEEHTLLLVDTTTDTTYIWDVVESSGVTFTFQASLENFGASDVGDLVAANFIA